MAFNALARRLLAGTAVLSLALLTACNPPSSSSNASASELPDSQDQLVSQAQKEGTVSLGAGGHTKEQAQLLADKFKDKYGITVEFIRENGGQISQKLQAQLSAGNVSFDVISLNDTSTLQKWSDDGTLADAQIPTADKVIKKFQITGGNYYPFTWQALGFSYNSAKIDQSKLPGTWAELAQAPGPKAVANAGTSGAALTFAAIMDQIQPPFMDNLSQGNILLSDSALALGQMVATGEADYGVPGVEQDVATAQLAGEPLKMGYPEGKIGAVPSYMGALSAAAHPAAARLLVQFAMSEEYQKAQTEIGSRATLTGIAAPKTAEELTDDRVVVLDEETLAKNRDQVLADFKESFK